MRIPPPRPSVPLDTLTSPTGRASGSTHRRQPQIQAPGEGRADAAKLAEGPGAKMRQDAAAVNRAPGSCGRRIGARV